MRPDRRSEGDLMRRYPLLLLVLVAAGMAATTLPAAADAPALPNSIAATGDSITRAFDVTGSCTLADCPAYSWATGTSTSVNSQYRRILAANAAVSGHGFNDAKTGAKMVDLDGQLTTAASQGVDYATVLMGANDACTSSVSTMTPTATFQAQFQTALTHF